jgi:outer membrane protein assembly factor BamE (lipoprotein component of BamABCDE complex)
MKNTILAACLSFALAGCATEGFWAPQVNTYARATPERIAQIRVNETTGAQVKELLGPPARTTRYDRGPRDVWIYNYDNQIGTPHILSVQMSPDGVVRELVTIRNPTLDKP